MTVADKILSMVLIAVSLIVIGCQGLWASDDTGKLIQISVDGEIYGKYEFKDKTLEIETEYGKNTVMIDRNCVWIEDANCPDKLDVKAGKIDKTGQMLVCLPNRLMIEIVGENKKVDKVTY